MKSNLNHMELAVSSIYLSHHMKYHQLVQYLAGKSKQDMDNVSSQKETLDSTVCFLQRRTSVCKPHNLQLPWKKSLDFLLRLTATLLVPLRVCIYTYIYIGTLRLLGAWSIVSILLHKIELHNSWQFNFLSFIASLFKIWISNSCS